MRVLVVVNARAGGSEAAIFDFLRTLGGEGVELVVRFAGRTQPIEDLVTDAASFDRVVAAGGDGTVSALCYAIRDSGVPVLVYPGGTANLIAQNLGIPTDPPALANLVLNGTAVDFDLCELERPDPQGGAPTRTGFMVAAGAGYDAHIMAAAQPLKATLGPAAYLVAALGNLSPTLATFELLIDGELVTVEGIAVLAMNFGRIQFDIAVSRGSDPRDGRLEVAVMRSKNVVGLLPAVTAAMLDLFTEVPDRGGAIEVWSGTEVQVSAYPPLKMQFDGETMEAFTPFAARVLHNAATLIVPDDCIWLNDSASAE